MSLKQDDQCSRKSSWTDQIIKMLALSAAMLSLLNVLYFVLRVSSPVIQQDAWYFFDVFLSKAIDGNLSLGDFFVRRAGADHSQPLFKLEMLMEWRFFDLDFTAGAIIGVVAAALCATIFYLIIVGQRGPGRSIKVQYLAWLTICGVLFSLNGDGGSWRWPLVALENVTTLNILLFMIAVWQAHKTQRFLVLAVITIWLGVTSDDSAIVAVVASVIAVLLMLLFDPSQRNKSTWKLLTVIVSCMFVVRFGYAYAPVVGGRPAPPLLSNIGSLLNSFRNDGWWLWLVLPLAHSLSYQNFFQAVEPTAWNSIQILFALLLAVAHTCFWIKAIRTKYDSSVFIALCSMILFYGWIAGIVLGRISAFGTGYLNQPRYISLYAVNLIALLIMWSGSPGFSFRYFKWKNAVGTSLAGAGCILFLAFQIPISIQAWHLRTYQWAYDADMAKQIGLLATDPAKHPPDCLPEQYVICGWRPEKRETLLKLMRSDRLNVFSPQMQRRHKYLPRLSPITANAQFQ